MTETSDNHPEEETNGDAAPAIPPTTLTRTYYEMLAAEIMEDLDRASHTMMSRRTTLAIQALRVYGVAKPRLAR